jgi:Flp pilus assembly protein TadG
VKGPFPRLSRLWRDRRGGTAVEFALISLVMMTWIFGIMEIARAFWTYQIIQEVAVQGARCMSILSSSCASGGSYSSTAAQTYMVNVASKLGLTLPASDINPVRLVACAGVADQHFSSVTITYTFKTNMPALIPQLSSIVLTASSCSYDTTQS